MRSAAKYIWIILVIAFVGGFLLAETSGLIGQAPVTTSTIVAKVNGEEIPYLAWSNLTTQLSQQQEQQSGRGLNLDERQQLEEQAFNQLVADVLLRQEYEKRGIRVTDKEIIDAARFSPPPQFMSSPELQTEGRFDPAKYQRFLSSPASRQQGILAQLEGYYRQEIPRQKLFSQIATDAYVSDARLWSIFKDARDSVKVSYVAFRPTEAQLKAATVTDAEIREFYKTNKSRFDRPGRAVISLVTISRTPVAADTAATIARLQALRSEITSGTSTFDAVALRASDDTISGKTGGDLGRGGRGRFVAPFETAAYALKVGEISQPVKTDFGYHLIKVTEKKGDTLAMRHILLNVKQSDSNATVSDRRADRLSAIAAGSSEPERLDSAAKELGLLVSQIPVREGQAAVYLGRQIAGVSGWAFSGPTVGENSDLLDDENAYYLARLDSLFVGGEQPLDAVKDEIRTALQEKKAAAALLPEAQKLAAAAKSSSLETAAAAAGMTVAQTPLFNRVGFVEGLGFFNEAIGASFALPVGTSAAVGTTDVVFVIRADQKIEASREEFELQKSTQRQQMTQALREQRVRGFLDNLRKAATIVDKRKDINSALRRQVVE